MMWHEARKQEKKIRGMIVDYHRRAERRRDYYEKIKADPTQFLQIHGRPCKIHLDPAVAAAGDSPANMMPWQGQTDNLIDRFDVRAHLDFIPQPLDDDEGDSPNSEERQANYERYRILVQNEFLGVPEEKFLRQLYLEEQFGPVGGQQSKEPPPNPDKKGKKVPGAAIGYVYDDDGPSPGTGGSSSVLPQTVLAAPAPTGKGEKSDSKAEDNADEDDEDSDIDFDMCLDVSKIDNKQAHEMNRCGLGYGMSGNDFFSFLTDDFEEQEALKLAREQEEEKAMFAGRKSRRERRAFREKKLVGRKISPPSYATRTSPTFDPYRMSPKSRSKSKSQSRSRSTSPVNTGVIQYITCFGGEEDVTAAGLSGDKQVKSVPKESGKRVVKRTHSSSSDRSTSRRIRKRSKSHSRSRSRSRSHSISRSRVNSRRRKGSSSRSPRSSSRSRSRSHSRSRRRSSSRSSTDSHYYSRRSRSRNRSRSVRRYRSSSSRSRSPRSRRRSHSGSFRNSHSPRPVGKKGVSSDHSHSQQPVRRYYGRNKGDSSSSELEASDTDDCTSRPRSAAGNTHNKNSRSGSGNTRPAAKATNSSNTACGSSSATKMTPQERLKKKMQALLNRQYKADKKAEKARMEKAEQERNDRKEELRELALKMRRRERERRHKMRDGDQDSDSDAGWTSDDSDSSSNKSSPARSSRRSRSPSPNRNKASDSKNNKWDAPNRSSPEGGANQRDESRRDVRSRKEDNYKSSGSAYRKEDNYYRDDGGSGGGSSHRRDDDSYYRRDTYRRDDSHGGGGPSHVDSYNRRDTSNRRYENDSYRTKEDSHYRSAGRGEWNRRDDGYNRPRYGLRRDDDPRNDSSRPKLVDY